MGALSGTKIVAVMPASRAAQATAWPWLPALAATTPAERSSGVRLAIVLTAPRILKAPVRCRFSALSSTSRPARRDSVSDGKTGVTRTRSRRRSRASAIALGVGAVVTDTKHLLHDLPDRGQGVELPPLHLVEQPLQLRVVAYRGLEVRLRATGRHGEHFTRQIAPPALLEPAALLQVGPVLPELLPEQLDVLPAHGLGYTIGGCQSRSGPMERIERT